MSSKVRRGRAGSEKFLRKHRRDKFRKWGGRRFVGRQDNRGDDTRY